MLLTKKQSYTIPAFILIAALFLTAGATYVLEIPRSVYTILGPAMILMIFSVYELILIRLTGYETLNETIRELDYETIYSLTR